MFSQYLKKPLLLIGVFACLWLGVKYVLPLILPFLLGAGLALAAEPLVKQLSGRVRRTGAAAVGVSATVLSVAALVCLVGAVAVRELQHLADAVPDLEQTARQGVILLQDWMVQTSEHAPESIRPVLQRAAVDFFDNGTVLMEQATQKIPGLITAVLGRVGNGALIVGTGIFSAFLISARLPKIRSRIAMWLPQSWKETYLPALLRVKKALGGWLKAQLKLMLVTWGILTVGFLLLRIPYAPAWAALVALVDAVPILGTGTILVPWAIISLLQKESLQAMGLLAIYGIASLTRTVLEPRLVGRHLGLDPLATLVALYIGYRLWGFLGLLLTPILASAARSLLTAEENDGFP